mgnify:CR=1 FL=1
MNKRLLTVAAFALAGCVTVVAQDKKKEFKMPTGYAGITHEMSEFYEPVPPVVTPGTDLKGGGFTAPSDAIVLFDGKDLSAWESVKGGAAEWDVHDGVFTVNKKKGDIQTKQKFNDFQMHIEWQVPTNITGESQSRGNSGIFLQGMYEVQVLDCYNNPTYVNGQTGSIYKQSIPLANAMRKPGEWNVYDIIYTAPTSRKMVLIARIHRNGYPERRGFAEPYDDIGYDRVDRFPTSEETWRRPYHPTEPWRS